MIVSADVVVEMYTTDLGWLDISGFVPIDPPITIDYGISGTGPLDLVADTGIMMLPLDNCPSQSPSTAGYFTPGHANCYTGWGEGTPVRFHITYDGTVYFKFLGRAANFEFPQTQYGEDIVIAEIRDWMDYASRQKIAQLAIQSNKRIDEVMPTILAQIPIQPRATSYGTGKETFAYVFNTDNDDKMSVMSLFQKLAQNEYCRIFVKGDNTGGETLRVDDRHTRILSQASDSIFTIDSDMTDIMVEMDRDATFNTVKAKIYPSQMDTDADTILWTNQATITLNAGESLTMTVPFRNPATGDRISATDVSNPLQAGSDYDMGSYDGGSDLTGSLGISATVGGNSAVLTLTNNASVVAYIGAQKLMIHGRGIYFFDPAVYEAVNSDSVDLRGERELNIDLSQHTSLNDARAWATYLVGIWATPRKMPTVTFLANSSSDAMVAALSAEPSARITLRHGISGINGDYFINQVHYEIRDGWKISTQLVLVPVLAASALPPFLYDVSNQGYVDAGGINGGYWVF